MFPDLYFAATCVAVVAVASKLARIDPRHASLLSFALLAPLLLAYLWGMYRSDGIDFDNYHAAYYDYGIPIPDIGYTAVTVAAREIGLSLSSFLLLQGLFTLAVLARAARVFDAEPVVVIAVYLMHMAIVRDLSQSRIGLAVAVFLLSQTLDRRWARWSVMALSLSVHFTAALLLLLWPASAWAQKGRAALRRALAYAVMLAFALFGSGLLSFAALVDSRVDIYLAWSEPGYGDPLESFGSLFRTAAVLLLCVWASWGRPQNFLQRCMFMELAGAAVLVGLSQYSIFAARLSNIVVSFYPLCLGVVAAQCHRLPSRPLSVRRSGLHLLTVATLALLIARPGSFDALETIRSALLGS